MINTHRRLVLAPHSSSRYLVQRWATNHSASSRLFTEAEAEERASSPSPQRPLVQELDNWTGDENIPDAVLRMLVDKYKHSRTGHIEVADAKIKRMMPKVMSPPAQAHHISTGVSIDDGEHKPWLVTFKAPSHATSPPAIKYGRLPPSPRTALSTLDTTPDDPRAQAQARRLKKRVAGADQLTEARKLALDYRLGGSLVAVQSPQAMPKNPKPEMEESDRSQISRRMQPNPISIKAWASLTEEKIERARSKGQFDNLRGRGKPFLRDANEANPFIPTEEFLMNRIIQRNGAAPPWIEIQQEMDASLSAFRRSLQVSWVRRVIRALTIDRPPSTLVGLSEATIASIRDPEWESREAKYHEHALNEVNTLIRKYNNAAPYAVRKLYLQLLPELEGCFELAAPRIMKELATRAREPSGDTLAYSPSPGQASSLSASGSSDPHNQGWQRTGHQWSLMEAVRRWLSYSSVKV